MRRTLAIISAATLVICLLAPAWGQVSRPSQFRGAPPRWEPVPSAPGVEYSPGLKRDVFRYQEKYYYFDGSKWHCGRNYQGPWVQIPEPPQTFYRIEEHYFHTPPGWARGKKTGWGPYDMPPGKAKKAYGTGPPGQSRKGRSLPPGQMK